jgi:hypothetical protein
MIGGKRHGPVDASELKRLALEGVLAPTDSIWKEGLHDWVPLSHVKGIVFAARPAPPESSTSAPATASAPSIKGWLAAGGVLVGVLLAIAVLVMAIGQALRSSPGAAPSPAVPASTPNVAVSALPPALPESARTVTPPDPPKVNTVERELRALPHATMTTDLGVHMGADNPIPNCRGTHTYLTSDESGAVSAYYMLQLPSCGWMFLNVIPQQKQGNGQTLLSLVFGKPDGSALIVGLINGAPVPDGQTLIVVSVR